MYHHPLDPRHYYQHLSIGALQHFSIGALQHLRRGTGYTKVENLGKDLRYIIVPKRWGVYSMHLSSFLPSSTGELPAVSSPIMVHFPAVDTYSIAEPFYRSAGIGSLLRDSWKRVLPAVDVAGSAPAKRLFGSSPSYLLRTTDQSCGPLPTQDFGFFYIPIPIPKHSSLSP